MFRSSTTFVKKQRVFTKDDLVKTKFFFRLTFLVAFMAILSLFYIWSRVQIVQYGYEINELKQKQHQLMEQNQRLKLEVATMKSPSRIEALASMQLKMAPPTKEQIRFILIGK